MYVANGRHCPVANDKECYTLMFEWIGSPEAWDEIHSSLEIAEQDAAAVRDASYRNCRREMLDCHFNIWLSIWLK